MLTSFICAWLIFTPVPCNGVPCPPFSNSWGIPKSAPPCFTSNSLPRMSGANALAPSKSASTRGLPSHETGNHLCRPPAHSCPDSSAQHRELLSRCGPPLPLLSPGGLPPPQPTQSTPPRSPPAGLLGLGG